jgi:hypothetical protein
MNPVNNTFIEKKIYPQDISFESIVDFNNNNLLISCKFPKIPKYRLYEINSNLDTIISKDFNFQIIDMDKINKNTAIMLACTNENKDLKFIYIDSNFKIIDQYILNNTSNIKFSKITPIRDSLIIMIGIDTVSKIPLVSSYNKYGKIIWNKYFPNWISFSNIIINRKSFFITGTNLEALTGFIEFSNDGINFKECFKPSGLNYRSYDIEIFNDSTIFLSFYGQRYNSSCQTMIAKVIYSSLYQENKIDSVEIPDTTTKPVNIKFEIIFSPNPSKDYIYVTLSKKNILYDYSIFDVAGIEVKRVELKAIKTDNFKIDIRDLSTGMYFIQLNTEKGKIINKIMKY